MSDLRISVIVPHYNDLARLDLCLAALMNQTVECASFEVIVADNMSPVGEDAVRALIAGRARLVLAPEKGAGPARNAGAAAAAGEILAFTDADCLPDPGWLAAGVAALSGHDFVGGAMRVSIDTAGPLSGAQAFELVFAFNNRDYVERKGFTVTANLFCRKTIFERVGPFRTEVSEDFEWCARARGLGLRLGYAPAAVVAHPARQDWPALLAKWRRIQAESYALALAPGGGGRGRWLMRAWAMPLSILAHGPRVLTSPLLGGPVERLRALITLVRLRLWRFVDAHRLALQGR